MGQVGRGDGGAPGTGGSEMNKLGQYGRGGTMAAVDIIVDSRTTRHRRAAARQSKRVINSKHILPTNQPPQKKRGEKKIR